MSSSSLLPFFSGIQVRSKSREICCGLSFVYGDLLNIHFSSPDMRGTDYVWRTYVAPYLDKHEEVIEAWSAWLSSVFGENVSRVAQLAQQRAKEALFTTVYGGQLPEPKKKVEAVSPSPHKDDPAVSNMLSRKSSRQTEAEALDQAPSMDMSPAAIRQRTKSAFQDIVDSVWSFD